MGISTGFEWLKSQFSPRQSAPQNPGAPHSRPRTLACKQLAKRPAFLIPDEKFWEDAGLVRRRITKKSAPSALVVRQESAEDASSEFCPYRTLGIPRSATALQVRKAYLRLALKYHPDKLHAKLGREPAHLEKQQASAMSKQIAEAFEILADATRRQCYNDGVETSSDPRDGGEPPTAKADARLLMHKMQVYKETVDVSLQTTPVLRALHSLLSGERQTHPSETDEKKQSPDTCIHARGKNYEVTVTWSCFDVITSGTRSLERALAWRAALTELKQKAKRRLQDEGGGGRSRTLLDEEISEALVSEPDLVLTFRSFVGVGSKSKRTPQTPNWHMTLSQQAALNEATTSQKGDVKKKVEKCLERAKLEVQRDRKLSESLREKELQKVQTELNRRRRSAEALAQVLGLITSAELNDAVEGLRRLDSQERSRRVQMLLAPYSQLALEEGWEDL